MSEVQRYVDRLVTQKIETHDFEDGGDGKCTHPIYQTTCGYPMNHIIHGYKALPADWHEDSSLETWFPLTAEELKRVKAERDEQAGVIMADTAHIESLTASLAKAEAELSAARETITRLADAANKLIAAMDTCHICGGVLIVEEGPSHCENCSYDCEGHEGEECTPIYEYHRRLDELTLPYVTVQQDKGEGKDGK